MTEELSKKSSERGKPAEETLNQVLNWMTFTNEVKESKMKEWILDQLKNSEQYSKCKYSQDEIDKWCDYWSIIQKVFICLFYFVNLTLRMITIDQFLRKKKVVEVVMMMKMLMK